jgi:hypothetical protein
MRAADIAEHARAIKRRAPRVCAAIQVENTTLLHREGRHRILRTGLPINVDCARFDANSSHRLRRRPPAQPKPLIL